MILHESDNLNSHLSMNKHHWETCSNAPLCSYPRRVGFSGLELGPQIPNELLDDSDADFLCNTKICCLSYHLLICGTMIAVSVFCE